MADVFTKGKRSEIMRSVKSSETKPEILVRKYLFSLGFRYRKNYGSLPGKPDIVLPKYRTIIFINGCFWHGHANCEAASLPKSNTDYWTSKISRNRERDIRKRRELRALGWRVFVLWECNVAKKRLQKLVRQIVGPSNNPVRFPTIRPAEC